MTKNSKLASSNRATVLSAVVVLATICAIRPNTGAAEVIQTAQGAIRGSEADGTEKFLGIPYATPPVGDSRWMPPQPHGSWSGVLNATELGSHCAQTARVVGAPSSNEDCLFLNVYVPAAQRGIDTRERAVMVWIHGGAFTAGESDDFDASDLASTGNVVVVTVNYRLGVLGFLAHPALTAEAPDRTSGNYGNPGSATRAPMGTTEYSCIRWQSA